MVVAVVVVVAAVVVIVAVVDVDDSSSTLEDPTKPFSILIRRGSSVVDKVVVNGVDVVIGDGDEVAGDGNIDVVVSFSLFLLILFL